MQGRRFQIPQQARRFSFAVRQSTDLSGPQWARHALLWRRPPGTFSDPWGVTVLRAVKVTASRATTT